jgi:DNA-binding CsgD family transcriptional regulator
MARIVPLGHRLPKEEHERRLALWRKGLTDPEIAKAAGVSLSTITNWRHRAGLRRVNKRKRKDDKYFKLIRCNDPLPPDELAVMKKRLRAFANADW